MSDKKSFSFYENFVFISFFHFVLSMLVAPEQYKNEHYFVVPEGGTDPYRYYLSLTVMGGEQDGLLLDGSSMDGVM